MYNLELEEIAKEINEKKINLVLIQLPDGLKPKAQEIADFIEEQTGAEPLIWFGNCYGACDIPLSLKFMEIGLVLQFGHNKFNKMEW